MNAANIHRIGTTRISVSTIVEGTEYAVKMPISRATIPIFEMTAEPKSDKRRASAEVAL